MKTYCYYESNLKGDSFVVKNEKQILDEYWDYWKERMEKKYGKDHELITKENCIEDWTIIHWAEEYYVVD